VFLFLSSVINAGQLSGKKILFDAAHAQDAGNSDWLINTSYSSWADELESEGAEINAINYTWNLDLIKEFDVFIIPEPQSPFSQNDISILDELLNEGKGIFIIANGSGIDTNGDGYDCPTIVNAFLKKYNILCENDNIQGNPLKTKNYKECGFVNSDTSVSCWGATTFTGKGLHSALSTDYNKSFLGYESINNGRLLLLGDSDLFADGSGTAGDTLYNDYKLGTHKKLSIDSVLYLAGIITPSQSSDNGTSTSNSPYEDEYQDILQSGYSDDSLIAKLHDLIDNQHSYSYTEARQLMFSDIDNKNGYVEGVYTGVKIKTSGIPDGTVMNCEHTWPQSQFGSDQAGIKKTDLFHLYPADSKANSIRSSYHFGEVVSAKWEKNGSKLGTDAHGATVFEPRDVHKGNVARSIFYFSVRYGMKIGANEEEVLRKWNKLDPVDDAERARCNKIYSYQHNRNPFIDHPEFVDKISDF